MITRRTFLAAAPCLSAIRADTKPDEKSGELVFSLKTWEGEYATKDIPGGVQSTPVFVEDSYLVGLWSKARGFKNLGRKSDVPFDALQGIPLFLAGPANAFREKLEQTALRRRVELNIVAEVDSLTVRRDLALKGVGFTILSGTAIHPSPLENDVFALRIVRPRILRQICFVRSSTASTSRAAIEVAQIIDQTLRALLDQAAWTGASPSRKASLLNFA